MLQCQTYKQNFDFNFSAQTSRGNLTTKTSHFVNITDSETGSNGLGECSFLEGLNPCDLKTFETKIQSYAAACNCQNLTLENIDEPAIRFGFETALLDLKNHGRKIFFPSKFTDGKTGIKINGLIWMGDFETMKNRIKGKLAQGFDCLKLKIGGINFEDELKLLEFIRNQNSEIELRLDANGAFKAAEALPKLEALSQFKIHSIEQPLPPQSVDLQYFCRDSPIPIALDEELIGLKSQVEKEILLRCLKPQFIVLKPSLVGGLKETEAWIKTAENLGVQWWMTSALESNIGLNAIAQQTFLLAKSEICHGLGTGQLYKNNIPAALFIQGQYLFHRPEA